MSRSQPNERGIYFKQAADILPGEYTMPGLRAIRVTPVADEPHVIQIVSINEATGAEESMWCASEMICFEPDQTRWAAPDASMP